MKVKTTVIKSSIRAKAMALSNVIVKSLSLPIGIDVITTATEKIATKKYLEVTPTEPQSVMWVVPGNEIEYTISSNTDWWVE